MTFSSYGGGPKSVAAYGKKQQAQTLARTHRTRCCSGTRLIPIRRQIPLRVTRPIRHHVDVRYPARGRACPSRTRISHRRAAIQGGGIQPTASNQSKPQLIAKYRRLETPEELEGFMGSGQCDRDPRSPSSGRVKNNARYRSISGFSVGGNAMVPHNIGKAVTDYLAESANWDKRTEEPG